MTTIGVLGVGRAGAAVARTAIKAGFPVVVAGSGPAEDIALLAEIVIPGARAMVAAEAARVADVVVLAVPLARHTSVEPAALGGKIVIDAMNHWAPTDGELPAFEGTAATSSEIVGRHFLGARLVKAFNHIGYHDLEEHALPAGSPARRALAVASDDEDAARVVADLVERFGFDAVLAGPLRSGAAFEPGTRIFNGVFDSESLRRELDLVPALPL